jgi:hypothetical protein
MPDYPLRANYGHLRHLHLWQRQLFKNLNFQQPSSEISWTATRPQTPPAKKITQNVLGTKWVKMLSFNAWAPRKEVADLATRCFVLVGARSALSGWTLFSFWSALASYDMDLSAC